MGHGASKRARAYVWFVIDRDEQHACFSFSSSPRRLALCAPRRCLPAPMVPQRGRNRSGARAPPLGQVLARRRRARYSRPGFHRQGPKGRALWLDEPCSVASFLHVPSPGGAPHACLLEHCFRHLSLVLDCIHARARVCACVFALHPSPAISGSLK
ncbi:hypothetical protein LZ32DRAFT_358358 [Colletotrichum eremochloae]|nr:hypothetical protein LZ32DRAFT_358358 [Colletotrichum eremochloae]